MEFEVQDVVNQLATRIGTLEVDLAISNAKSKKIEEINISLREEIRMLQEDNRVLRENRDVVSEQ